MPNARRRRFDCAIAVRQALSATAGAEHGPHMGRTAAQNVADGFDGMPNPENVINNAALGSAPLGPLSGVLRV